MFPASFLLKSVRADFAHGKLERFLLQWPSGRASVSEAGGPGPVVVSGCRNAVCGRAVVFHFRQSRKRGSLSSSVRLIRSLSTRSKRSWLCAAQNTAPQLSTNSISSPSRGGCFMKRFSADVVHWPLAHRNSQLLSALATYCFVRCSPIFALRHLLRRSRFAFAAFDCAGVKADPW